MACSVTGRSMKPQVRKPCFPPPSPSKRYRTFPPLPGFTPRSNFLPFFLLILHLSCTFNFDFPHLSSFFLFLYVTPFFSLFSYFLPQMTAAHISAPVLREEYIFLYVQVHPCETRKSIGDADRILYFV